MGPIGSKICDEDVSRDDPKQTIDSRSLRIDFTPMMKRGKGDVCLPLVFCV
jgi:hypothetical protein